LLLLALRSAFGSHSRSLATLQASSSKNGTQYENKAASELAKKKN
jgi:hypothetical protein